MSATSVISLRSIAEAILNKARGGGLITDDDNVNFQDLYYQINNYRAKLIRERYLKDHFINSYAYQDLGCIPTVCKDISDCCPGQKIQWGQNAYHIHLPEIVDIGVNHGIFFLGYINKQKRIPILKQGYSQYRSFAPYAQNDAFAVLNTNIIYIFSKMPIKYVNVTAILKDPLSINTYCNDDECLDEFSSYPIDSTIIPTLENLIIQDFFSVSLATNPDLLNDANGTIIQKGSIPAKQAQEIE